MDTRARLLFSGEATHTYFQKCGLPNDACTEMDTNDEELANLLNEITLEMSPGDFTVAGDAVPFVAQHLTHTDVIGEFVCAKNYSRVTSKVHIKFDSTVKAMMMRQNMKNRLSIYQPLVLLFQW